MKEEAISLSDETINKLAEILATKLAPVVTPPVPTYPSWTPPYHPGQYYLWNTGGEQA